MSDALTELEPDLVWTRFRELTHIARPPKEEAAVREHVLAWAKGHGFESAVDGVGNAVIRVPSSDRRDRARTVVLQAHLDMVCERDPSSPYDARAGRIQILRDGDWLYAEGTTLGADNGIGVAAAMATAEDPDAVHGPLELLFTVSEEEGLEGAKGLDPRLVSGRLLVNLDGTSDDALTIGCAGSTHTFVRARLVPGRAREDHVVLRVAVSGARGGHSGGDIASGRANAIEVLGHVLRAGRERVAFGLSRLDGGISRNAIPREADAVVSVPSAGVPTLRREMERTFAEVRSQYASSDSRIALTLEELGGATAADETSTGHVLELLEAIPTGVVAMSATAPGSVETSSSLNVVRTEDRVVTLASMSRSASAAGLESVVSEIERTAREHGADVDVLRSYPPWQPDLDSRLLTTARSTYERLVGGPPRLEIVHGGLECAVLGARLPGIEMIALGPRIEGPHAPGERLGISSTQRFYRLLRGLLDDLSR